MEIDDRDRDVLTYVARFKQLTSPQIRELCFASLASDTPCYRTLRRLVKRQQLAIIQHPHSLIGGAGGGRGPVVYQLGPDAWYLFREGRYRPRRAVDSHALAIADTYLSLLRLARADKLTINGYSTEPDCHQVVGGQDLKPDLYADLRLPSGGDLKLWLEVDLGSEGQRQIKGKLERYWRAYRHADMEEFPLIIWVAVDEFRKKELVWILKQGGTEAQQLFRVMTLRKLIASLELSRVMHRYSLI